MRSVFIFATFVICAFSFISSIDSPSSVPIKEEAAATSPEKNHWDQGLAEVNKYNLKQNRYKDIHPGEVVLVFVKEDFLTDKQVKNETYTDAQSTPVLKNIFLRKFTTGIYDYSMSTNTFTAFDQTNFPGSIKIQSSSTEWCGTSYMQFNGFDDKYKVELRSYFETEGDQNFEIDKTLLEDELFNLIRIDPSNLPVGKINIIPSAQYLRLAHAQTKVLHAFAEVSPYSGKEFRTKDVLAYKLEITSLKRTLTIYFEDQYPHTIVGWDDRHPSIFDGEIRTSSARLSHQVMKAYWKHNTLEDTPLRKQLGLQQF